MKSAKKLSYILIIILFGCSSPKKEYAEKVQESEEEVQESVEEVLDAADDVSEMNRDMIFTRDSILFVLDDRQLNKEEKFNRLVDFWMEEKWEEIEDLDVYTIDEVENYLQTDWSQFQTGIMFDESSSCKMARKILRKKLCDSPYKLVKNVIRKQTVGSVELSLEGKKLAVIGPTSATVKTFSNRINVLLSLLNDRKELRCNVMYGGCAPLYLDYHCNDNMRADKLEDYKNNCAKYYDGSEYAKTKEIVQSFLTIAQHFRDDGITDADAAAALLADISNVQAMITKPGNEGNEEVEKDSTKLNENDS